MTVKTRGQDRGVPLTVCLPHAPVQTSDLGVSTHAGKERLAACLGVTVPEATRFLESFLQKYRKIRDFAQATIARCQQTGEPAAAPAQPPAPLPGSSRVVFGPCSPGVVGGDWVNVQHLLGKWDQKAPPDKGAELG